MPINITSNEIDTLLKEHNLSNTWFIGYKLDCISPNIADIDNALKNGEILYVYLKGIIIDNYGFLHNIEYNDTDKKYNIIINNMLSYSINKTKLDPYCNSLIDIIGSVDNPAGFANINISNRYIFKHLLMEIDNLNKKINRLEDKLQK